MKRAQQRPKSDRGRDLRTDPCGAKCAHRPPRSREGGYALLFVLFLTAVLAVTLTRALPQIAMQSQRVREERLIYRGEQYKRAIQLYFRKYKKYPSSIDDLEETNGERFLRRRYKDPITGNDQWRLVHMGSDGRFTDSLVYDQKEEETGNAGDGSGIQPSAPIGSAASQAMPEEFAPADGRFRGAARARAIRRSAAPETTGQGPPSSAYFNQGTAGDPTQQVDPNDPYAVVGGAPGQEQPTQPQPGQYPAYSRTRPEYVPTPGPQQQSVAFGNQQQQAPNQAVTPQYRIGNPQQPATVGRNQRQPQQQPQQQQQQAVSPGAFGMAGAGNPAAQLISNLLTRPRPGGLAGIVAAQQGAGQQQSAFAGGIAGVASEAEDRGVKVYQGLEQYNQWEFVYDYRQDASFGGANVGPQAPGAATGQALPQGQPGISNSGVLNINPANIPGGAIPGAGNPYPQGYPTAGGAGSNPNAPANPNAQPQPEIDPVTGLPRQPDIDPVTGLPRQPDIDPVTGQPRQQPIDPNNPNQNNPPYADPYAAPPVPGDPNARQPQPGQPGLQAFPPGAFPFPGQPGYQPQQQQPDQKRRR